MGEVLAVADRQVHDPEMRHRRKSESQRFDGYKLQPARAKTEIVARGLAMAGRPADHPIAGELVRRKVERYCEIVVDEPPVTAAAAAFVRAAAERVPLAVVTGAFRPEVEQVLEAAGLRGHFEAVVTAEDVGERSKPHPEGYLRGLAALDGVAAAEALAFEDSIQGAGAARAAGLRVIAVRGTAPEAELAELVERVVDGLEPGLVAELLDEASGYFPRK